MITRLSDSQADRWRILLEEYQADSEWQAEYQEIETDRLIVRTKLLGLLDRYLTGQIDTEEFRATFDQKTRSEWNRFGLKGMSGAMFLNILVKYISDEPSLAIQLKLALPAPSNIEEGRNRMGTLLQFLEGVISSGEVTERQIQLRRVSFFLSAWWHLQNTELWPIFYVSGRRALEEEELYIEAQNPVEDYFNFRDSFLSLASTLGLKSWQLEHLLIWYAERDSIAVEPANVTEAATSTLIAEEAANQPEEEQSATAHTHVQWLLARIGHKMGCHVWIAANDRNKCWSGERLGDLSLDALPSLGIDPDSHQLISLIDVLWIKGKRVAAAFEVEHTTSVYSGLLRMSDLIALSPNLTFPLYIVTPEARLDKVRRELSRPTFQYLELHKRCGYFSEEKLAQQADAIMLWANDPSAIEKLATKVGDVNR